MIKTLHLLCALSLISFAPSLAAITSPKRIEQLVAQKVAAELQRQGLSRQPGQRVKYRVSSVDPRLRLADCDSAISVDLGSGDLIGRVTAKVECRGAGNWSIYVPVSVHVYKKVVTVRAPAARGKLLHPQDLQLTEKEVSNLTQGYFTRINEVANKQLKRSVTIHGVITPRMLIEPKVVKKGDEVMIIANKGLLSVSSPGVALADGRIGQQINVKNRSSNRIVKARIKEKGVVEVAI